MSSTTVNYESTPIQPDFQGTPLNASNTGAPGSGERAASPTYAQIAARTLSPKMSGNSTAADETGPAAPPPTPQSEESPLAAPFTQRETAPNEDDDLGWTTVATPKKSKKSKTKKNKGKGKETAPATPMIVQAPEPPAPDASPKSVEPRKRRRVDEDYGVDERSSVRRQEAPRNLSLASKSPILFTQSSPSPSYLASTDPGDNEALNGADNMSIDLEVEPGSIFGQPDFTHHTTASWNGSQSNRFEHLEPDAPGPSNKRDGGRRSDAARSERIPSSDKSPIPSRQPSFSITPPQTPRQSRGNRARTATPAAPSRIPTRSFKKRNVDRSPTPSSSRAQKSSSDVEMLLSDGESARSSSTARSATPPPPRRPQQRRGGRGRYSVAAIGNPPFQPSPSPEPTPYDIIRADPDIIITPEGSMKKVQGDCIDWKKTGMDPGQAKAWNDYGRKRPLIVAQFAEHGTGEAGVDERVSFLHNLTARLSSNDDVLVTPAHGPLEARTQRVGVFSPANREPVWYSIEGLSEEWCIAFVRAAWLHTAGHTLNFALWGNSIPSLCAAFRYTFRFRAKSKEQYIAIVRRALLSDAVKKVVLEVLLRDIERGGRWKRSLRDDAFGEVLDSVDVQVISCRVSEHTSEPVAFIYITPPTADWNDWTRFRDAIQNYGFGSPAAGHPIAFKGRVYCTFCHSLGHPCGHCPAKKFFFPPETTQPQHQQPSTSTGRGGNRGGRGRGAGRGRGGARRGL
ncbi:uncharacterized protein C8Q71DRAFT_862092 [Rhodofomes roseus]|uniref:Uncharacterized protein n=1 Tax=Rhodofomes roseus TaxID=34475 RepID=A0ABQ8K2I2_9APHY|nr:uncharacterized protein C8Q71DRAFT_862226 [Rhodofomes roseus]XP_047774203.1 uncharacterized protein C8Q71DRAFT_862092 [Rhodofomes roseus]KAH9830776.1 hypothetical protein C8Q71DRAFT_862226 [Rhodofomes roseus]KAH9830956.1 hypothetical protein C8Q71DRAFT_862092 [Rhodofomes roseus]